MRNHEIPDWLYLPLKLFLLIGFALPFILWGFELAGMTRKSEVALAEREIKVIEKRGEALVSPAKPTAVPSAVAANSGFVIGIDVSHYQGDVDWRQVAKTDIKFAYAKATGGADFVDPHFARNWQLAREVGLHRGAYHFFLAADDPQEQARHFVRTMGKLQDKDLPPMLDVETDDGTDIKTLQERALVWLKEVEKRTGRRPVLYTDNGFADKVLTDARFSRYPFWIADYAGVVSEVPSPWEKRGWHFWQYEETGKVPGIAGDVDRDKFKGTLEELAAFIEKSRVK